MTDHADIVANLNKLEDEQKRNSRLLAQWESIAPRIEKALSSLENGIKESVAHAAAMEIAAAKRNGRIDAIEGCQRRLDQRYEDVLDALENLPCPAHEATIKALEREQKEQGGLWDLVRDKFVEIVMFLVIALITVLLNGGWEVLTK